MRARRVLVLEYRLPLGCCVHLTPVFEALHRGGMEVTVATRGLGADVLRHSPFVDHLIPTPDPLTHLAAAAWSLRGQLRRRRIVPDCVLTGASDMRTRIALLGLLAAPGWRGGFTLKPRLYRRPLVYDAGLSLIGNNLRLARLAGSEAEVERPRVFFSEADATHAAGLLAEANPEGRPVAVMVTQNSGGQSTGWHPERWTAVVRAALGRGLAVVYVGTAGDSSAIAELAAEAGGGVSLAGQTTVSQLAAVLAGSDLVVSLDTGTMHVGRAVGVPMVVLGPSWQKPLEWLPLEVDQVRILRGEDRDRVPPGYRLDEIPAEAVIAAIDDLLERYPPTPRARAGRIRESVSSVDHLPTRPV